MNRKALSLLIVVVMVLSTVPMAGVVLAASGNPNSSGSLGGNFSIDPGILEKYFEDKARVRFVIAPQDGYEFQVYEALKKIGKVDPRSIPEFKFIVVELDRSALGKLSMIKGIAGIWPDRELKLIEPVQPHEDISGLEKPSTHKGETKPSMFWSVETVGAVNAWEDYGVYGEGVIVAVIDTGVDPIHPFLQVTMDGKRKLIDWKDFTFDGYVETENTATDVENGYLNVSGIPVYIGEISSANGIYHYGFLEEGPVYDRGGGFDFNGDGDTDDEFLVLVVNSSSEYDTVYVDTDSDFDLTDEVPLKVFSESGDTAVFATSMVGFVVAELDPNGNYLWIGWDNYGHGTHVAGTVAGYNDTYEFYGVAPNAQIMALKVFPTDRGAATSSIVSAMIYAAIYGPDGEPLTGDEADIITMSLGLDADAYMNYNDGTESAEIFYINYLADRYGVVFTIAAGNEGPGVNRVSSPGDATMAITVGAMFEDFRPYLSYGYTTVPTGITYFSNRGPRMDGLLDPDVVAPGYLILSSVPLWWGEVYDSMSGTSMATPHVAGAAAVLISYAKQHNLRHDVIKIKEALMFSAKKLDGQLMVDQGFGLIQVDKAIEFLEKIGDENTNKLYVGTTFTTFVDEYGNPLIPTSRTYDYISEEYGVPYLYRGIYARNWIPTEVPVYVYSLNYWGKLKLSVDADWLTLDRDTIEVAPHSGGEAFTVTIDKSKLSEPGIYEAIIYIDDPLTDQVEAFVPVTVIVPFNRNAFAGWINDTGIPGVTKHYFFDVPEGTQVLEITLRGTDPEGNPTAVFWADINEPTGQYYKWSGWVYWGKPVTTITIENPTPGVWEIAAYSGFGLWERGFSGEYNISVRAYSLTVDPDFLRINADSPGVLETSIKVTNQFSDLSIKPVALGLSKLDASTLDLQTVELHASEYWESEPIYITPDSDIYYLRVQVADMDADANVWFGVDYYDLNWNYVTSKYALVGPDSQYSADFIFPEPGYYVIFADVDYIDGKDSFNLTVATYMLKDAGNISIGSNEFELNAGDSIEIPIDISVNSEGTYFGVIGIKDSVSGSILSYTPVLVQVGSKEMVISMSGELTLGEPGTVTLNIFDKATLEPIDELLEITVNGKVYFTRDGKVSISYVPTKLKEEFSVHIAGKGYKTLDKNVVLEVKEPFDETVQYTTKVSPKVIYGLGHVVSYETFGNRLRITVDGPSGYTGYVLVPLPYSSSYVKVSGEGVMNYYYEVGSMATYLIVEVKYGSPVTFTVDFVPVKPAVSGLNYFYYSRFLKLNQTFTSLYQKALELGVDNETLEMALNYQQAAEAWYKEGLEYMNPMATSSGVLALIRFRRAYISIQDGIRILEKAIEDIEAEG